MYDLRFRSGGGQALRPEANLVWLAAKWLTFIYTWGDG